jgi:hypothetical protein
MPAIKSPRPFRLEKLDSRPIPERLGEIRCFPCIRNEVQRLPYFLEYYRGLGIDRFFFIVNNSTDGSTAYLLDQTDCHVFHCAESYFEGNVEPPAWTNAHLSVFGDGHWSLTVDADELLVYPACESIDLHALCQFLDNSGANALLAPLLDMYGDGPIARTRYVPGTPFLECCPFFDPAPGWTVLADGKYPALQMFGGVRQRVFWQGRYKRLLPPCLSKVPLVRWRRGMSYLISMHWISEAQFADIQGALLHFKFLTGFVDSMVESVDRNQGIVEKGLQERAVYIDAFRRNPELTMRDDNSLHYRDSSQLAELGWLKRSESYDAFVAARLGSNAIAA